jgi:hypothetical protein
MHPKYGRLARAILLAGGITAAIALPAITGTPLLPAQRDTSSHIAFAAPAANNDNNDDRTNDNSEERNIEGTVTDIKSDQDPPLAFVGMVGGGVWARMYNDQLHNSGVGVGDYVKMQGEYSDHGIFDAYQVDVVDRAGDDNDNNGNGNN